MYAVIFSTEIAVKLFFFTLFITLQTVMIGLSCYDALINKAFALYLSNGNDLRKEVVSSADNTAVSTLGIFPFKLYCSLFALGLNGNFFGSFYIRYNCSLDTACFS